MEKKLIAMKLDEADLSLIDKCAKQTKRSRTGFLTYAGLKLASEVENNKR